MTPSVQAAFEARINTLWPLRHEGPWPLGRRSELRILVRELRLNR